MVNLIVFVIAATVGFAGSRALRRSPDTVPASRPPSASPRSKPQRSRLERDRPVRSEPSRPAPPPSSHRGLTAFELERAALAETLGAIRLGRDGRPEVPERITLLMHPDDVRLLEDHAEDRISAAVGAIALDRRWRIAGSVTIGRRTDPSRRPGLPGVDVPVPTADDRESTPLVLRRSDDGRVHRLGSTPVTIGRGDDRDITVDDHRVSRDHARIEPRGARWLLTDSGSANGTFVDGHQLPSGRSFALVAGATIGIGPVEFRVGSAETPVDAVGSSPALSESKRIELARIHLPDDGRSRR